LIGHDLHTPNAKSLVKQSCCSGAFSLSLPAQEQYHAILTTIFMTKSSPFSAERGFTLYEMLVVFIIILGLAAAVSPNLKNVLESGKATKDLSNLRQIATLLQTYLNEKDQVLPGTATWPGTTGTPVLYPKYVATRRVFQSPFDKRPALETDSAPVSYTNIYVKLGANPSMLNVVSPASTFLMAPKYTGAATTWTGTATNAPDLPVGGTGETAGTHHGGTMTSVLFCDWHAENLKFGPASTAGTFQDTTSNPNGLKHWDPTQ
jgi:prepilin-type N-terminal cleavage/methylation domain-containing protein/prepilin-type processing-associated H-X9-DG protein